MYHRSLGIILLKEKKFADLDDATCFCGCNSKDAFDIFGVFLNSFIEDYSFLLLCTSLIDRVKENMRVW